MTEDTIPAQTPSKYWRIAVWIAIGALIAAAIVCVIWVLIGTQNGIVPRAFLTVLLLTAFAGVVLLEASVAANRPAWYMMLSMIGWVVVLLAGAVKIWSPMGDYWEDSAGARIVQLLLIALIVRLGILHVWLFLRAHVRRPTPFNNIAVGVTIGLVAVLAILLVIPLTFAQYEFVEFYWRVVVAVTILAAVGTAIVPLVRALTTPRPPRPTTAGYPYAAAPVQLLPWPMYADGITPLPALADGTPDFSAYAAVQPAQAAAPYGASTQVPYGSQAPAPFDPQAAQVAADQAAAAQAAHAAWAGGQVGAPGAPAPAQAVSAPAEPPQPTAGPAPTIPPLPPLPPQ